MLVAARAVLLPLDALGVQALVLRGEVVAILTLAAGENDFVSWHCTTGLRVEGLRVKGRNAPPALLARTALHL
jgi:hypothetical protein